MSKSTEKLREEAKDILCGLFKIPAIQSGSVDEFIDKILLCAMMETMAVLKTKIEAIEKGLK